MISVIIPVYNEKATVAQLIRGVSKVPFEKEIIVVDDGSNDGTADILKEFSGRVKLISHDQNKGKGAAIRTALREVRGNIVIIQDADLEYDPSDYGKLLQPILKGETDVVYGSRNLKDNPKSSPYFYIGGVFLSKLANFLYGAHITDEATGYKVFITEVLKSLNLRCNGFEFCPEVTAKVLRRGHKIKEIPISYQPRGFDQGKKICWLDGVKAIITLLKYRFCSLGF